MNKDENINKDLLTEKILTVWGAIVIFWSLYRANIFVPLWINELIAKPIIFLLPIIIFLNSRKKNFFKEVGFLPKKIQSEVLFSLCLFFVTIGFAWFVSASTRGISFFNFNRYDSFGLLIILGLSLATAISEEIVARGFIFNQLFKLSGNFLNSLFVSSCLFFILYLPGILTTKVLGEALLVNLFLNFLMSFILGIFFYLRGNIWSSILFHTALVFLLSLSII